MSTNDEWLEKEGSDQDARHAPIYASLSAERTPSPQLKQRTMAAAWSAGYLRLRRRREGLPAVGLIAAALIVFAGGALVGYAVARRGVSTAPPGPAARPASTEAVVSTQGFSIDSDPRRHVVWY